MKHPHQATLALHAGGDLGFFARWRTERHLKQCDGCRAEVDGFAATRQIVPELAEIPEIPWNRLAAEMRANIRLGLEAGDCVRAGEPRLRDTRLFTGARAAVAMASVAALLVTGIVLERPAPRAVTTAVAVDDGMVVQATSNSIQVKKGGQTLRLMNPGKQVSYSSDAQGSMRARYVDPETGLVTINNIYAE
jgi:hypothetical protein